MSTRAVSKGIVSVGGWSVAKLATSALVLPVLARYLGIEGYGQYAYYLAVLLARLPICQCRHDADHDQAVAERPEDLSWCRAVAQAGALINGAGVLFVGLAMGLLIWHTASQGTAAASDRAAPLWVSSCSIRSGSMREGFCTVSDMRSARRCPASSAC